MHLRSSVSALFIAAVVLTGAQRAHAGTYTVAGCNGWSAYNGAPSHVAVYGQCPGLVARNVGGNFASPSGAEGGWSFTAPGGSAIAQISMAGYFQGVAGWQATALSEGGGSPGGSYPLENCPGAGCPGGIDYLGTYPVPNAAAVRLRLRCGASSCSNGASNGAIALSNVNVVINDYTWPTVAITGGSLVAGQWRAGTQTVDAAANDNTGISALRAYVDGSPRADQPRPGCSWGALVPCPNGGGSIAVSTTGLSDGPHALMVQAVDSGGFTANDSRTIYVDNVAPTAPVGATIEGGDGWRSTNAFAIRWTDPSQSAAPITEAGYRFCPAGSTDATKCVAGSVSRTAGSGVTKLTVPAAGDWSLRVWLRDAAGNESGANSVLVGDARFDPTPPSNVSIAPTDPANPTQIRVAATDEISGVAGGEVEVQRDGESVWRPLPTQLAGGGLTATLDDSQLPDGAYRVRARVVDAAGNERSTTSRDDGAAATLSLPLRIKTRLAVGRVKHVRARSSRGRKPQYHRILVTKPRTRYGRTIRLSGRLTTPGANPVAGVGVSVYEQLDLPGAQWTHVADVPTSRTGRFTFKALRGPSRLVQFRYGGTATVRPRTSTVQLLVRGSSSLDVDRHRFVNGDDVIFRGHVRGRPLPPEGKLVELQVYTRRRWRTFAQPRADAATGRWSYRYKFETVRGHERFRFRARVRKETGYPYELGTSSAVNVFVRGV